VAVGRRGEPGHAVGVQRLDAQIEPAIAVATRCRERVPARPVEAQHAAARKFDRDVLGSEVADQRSLWRSDREARHALEQPRASRGALHCPEQRRERSGCEHEQQHEHGREPAQDAPARPLRRCARTSARRRWNRVDLVHGAPIRT
jgi:hypothetical protein